jgi:predicted TIM-barrel fold metal-dependent hydrolase
MRIVDGDGHVIEDMEGLTKFLPFNTQQRSVFPPLDHLHSQGSRSVPGSFQRVGPGEWLEFMDEVGIETAVLYPTAGLACGQITNPDWAITTTRAYNDWLAETFTSRTPRLKGVGLVPLQEPDAAVQELRRVVNDLGFCGAMLPSNGLPKHLGSRDYWPVYEEANRLGCAIAAHGGCHNRMGLDDMNGFVPIHALGHPFGLMISFAGMVFNGVFDRFPNARFGFLEGGVGWLPFVLERFDRSYETFFDYSPSGQLLSLGEHEKVSDYLRRHIKAGRIYVGGEGNEATLPTVVKMAGSEAVLYASDFPHEVNTDYCKEEINELIEHEELTQEDKEAILHGNAERFYKLTPTTA